MLAANVGKRLSSLEWQVGGGQCRSMSSSQRPCHSVAIRGGHWASGTRPGGGACLGQASLLRIPGRGAERHSPHHYRRTIPPTFEVSLPCSTATCQPGLTGTRSTRSRRPPRPAHAIPRALKLGPSHRSTAGAVLAHYVQFTLCALDVR